MDTRSSSSSGTGDHFFRVLFVLGGPGAGKGTQCALLAQHYPAVHLSVGELLRHEQTKLDSPHRELIERTLVAGKIVPVEISLQLLQQAMRDAQQAQGPGLLYLVDGFPRNFDNLHGWCRVMHDTTALMGVLVYTCPLTVLEERILHRAEQGSGRSDDNLASLRKRFDTFEQDTLPIVESLRATAAATSQWSVLDISGDQSLEDVWRSTQAQINPLILHDVVTANAALLEAVRAHNVTAYTNLCAPEWFESDKDPTAVMEQQEGAGCDTSRIGRAQLDVISGRQVALSYDRPLEDMMVREKRIWTHQGPGGWRNVHFSRTTPTGC